MAFNPFHGFRKHQKVVFAALTIVCMLTFVLASGVGMAGDFFSELSRWLGGQRRSGTDVARLYGSRVSGPDIQTLRNQRRAANAYMASAVQSAHDNLFNKVFDALQYNKVRKDQELKNLMNMQTLASRYGKWGEERYLEALGRYVDQLQQEESKRTDAKETSGSNRVRKLVGDINIAARQWMWLMKDAKDPLYPAANLYFGGATTVDGLLDFMIWRRQADQLGIQLTDQDIAAAVRYE